jgi:hypothetical protein
MAAIENREAHAIPSKIWSSLRPDVLAAAMSSSVILWAYRATFIDERAQRIGMACVIERSTALVKRCLTFSFENPRDQRSACLFNVSHATSPLLSPNYNAASG